MIDWDAVVLAPVMGVFGEDESHGLPIYRPTVGGSFALRDAVFDDAFKALVLTAAEDGLELNTIQPVLGVRLALFPQPPALGDQVEVPRVAGFFVVRDIQPDGHGHAKLYLNRAAQ